MGDTARLLILADRRGIKRRDGVIDPVLLIFSNKKCDYDNNNNYKPRECSK